MTALTIAVAAATYVLMLAAFFGARMRAFHVPVMVAVITFDLAMPFYLYASRDWYRRLIEQEEIFSFLIWMHFLLVLTLYALYVIQIFAGRRLLRGDNTVRGEHRSQGVGILIVRALVIVTAMLLVEPEST